MVNHLKEAGKTLSRIIDDVLDLAKIESRQLAVNSQPFELAKSLRNVRSLLENGALAKGLTLRINYSPDIGAGWFVGDPLRLEQILLNLVGNAIKFTEKGEVCLSVTETSILSTTARLRFDVQDSGIGVDLAQTSWLFEPFGQADPTISRKFGGTGLGLSISKRLVEAMGGKMGVESTLGVGSTFWFELPFGLPIEKLAKRSDMANLVVRKGPRLKGLRCLVVDDTRLNRMIIEQMLSREGATSDLAVNGEEALQRLRERPSGYDAVLMDVQMPVMDGLAAARAIHGELGLTSLPIVALTAGVMSDQRQQALEAGCQDFLPKPVDLEDLVLTLLPLRKSPV